MQFQTAVLVYLDNEPHTSSQCDGWSFVIFVVLDHELLSGLVGAFVFVPRSFKIPLMREASFSVAHFCMGHPFPTVHTQPRTATRMQIINLGTNSVAHTNTLCTLHLHTLHLHKQLHIHILSHLYSRLHTHLHTPHLRIPTYRPPPTHPPAHPPTHPPTHTHLHTPTHTHTYTHTPTHIRSYTRTYTPTYTSLFAQLIRHCDHCVDESRFRS